MRTYAVRESLSLIARLVPYSQCLCYSQERLSQDEAEPVDVGMPCSIVHFLLDARALIFSIGHVKMPHSTLRRQDDHADNTTRTAVPLDRLLQRSFHEIHALFLVHVFSPVGIAVAVDVRRTGTADGVCLLVKRAAERNGVDLASVAAVVACDDHTSTVAMLVLLNYPLKGETHSPQLILVLVAKLLKECSGRLCCRRLIVSGAVHAQIVVDNVCHSLRVCRRA